MFKPDRLKHFVSSSQNKVVRFKVISGFTKQPPSVPPHQVANQSHPQTLNIRAGTRARLLQGVMTKGRAPCADAARNMFVSGKRNNGISPAGVSTVSVKGMSKRHNAT